MSAIRGLGHLTLAVTQLERSIAFYREGLGFRLKAAWQSGAYLEAGPLWLCLSVDDHAVSRPHPDYTHLAFDIDPVDFAEICARVREIAPQWKDNRSEGDSLYFLDPDGHKLELHVGTLESRLAFYRANPEPGRTIFD